MSNKSVCISLIATLTASALPGLPQAEAQQGAKVNLSRSYPFAETQVSDPTRGLES
jgi:hypothetical protein